MSDDFLLALRRNFSLLLSSEDQVVLALDALITDLLHWLSGAQDSATPKLMDQVHITLEELDACGEKKIIQGAMSLLKSVVDQNLTAPVWQIIDYLRQTSGSLRERSAANERAAELPLAA